MANGPGSAGEPGARGGDTAKLRLRRARKRHPVVALIFALVGVGGLAVAGFQIDLQLKPRTFTIAQQRRIEAWEVARRWRVTPKAQIFPATVPYQVGGGQLGTGSPLRLTARRIVIAPQAACGKAADAGVGLVKMLDQQGCLALMRATYTDATDSLVLTVGIAVLRNQTGAVDVTRYLTGAIPGSAGAVSKQLVLLPVHVDGTPAALFGTRQRQMSWVVGAGSYVVMATVGYADGRPRVPVPSDSYTDLEMTGLASAVADAIAAPFAAPPPVPHCPGATACLCRKAGSCRIAGCGPPQRRSASPGAAWRLPLPWRARSRCRWPPWLPRAPTSSASGSSGCSTPSTCPPPGASRRVGTSSWPSSTAASSPRCLIWPAR